MRKAKTGCGNSRQLRKFGERRSHLIDSDCSTFGSDCQFVRMPNSSGRTEIIGIDAGNGILQRPAWTDEFDTEARGYRVPPRFGQFCRANGFRFVELVTPSGHRFKCDVETIGATIQPALCR